MCVKQAVGSSCMPEKSVTSGYKAAPKERTIYGSMEGPGMVIITIC